MMNSNHTFKTSIWQFINLGINWKRFSYKTFLKQESIIGQNYAILANKRSNNELNDLCVIDEINAISSQRRKILFTWQVLQTSPLY